MLQSARQSLPLWVMYLQALGLPLFALVLTLFGIRNAMVQTRVSKEKLRHDLYDRRYAIYWAFANMINSYFGAENSAAIFEAWEQAFVALHQSSFILNSEMKKYLKGLNDTVFTMYMEEGRYRGNNDHIAVGDSIRHAQQRTQNFGTLQNILPVLAEKFEPFLKLDDLTKRSTSKTLC